MDQTELLEKVTSLEKEAKELKDLLMKTAFIRTSQPSEFSKRVDILKSLGFTETKVGMTDGTHSFLWNQIDTDAMDETAWKDYVTAVLAGKSKKPLSIFDRVKTFEDACEVLDFPKGSYVKGTKDEIAYKKLKVIIRALNEGWEPNYVDSNEKKWRILFKFSDAGFHLFITVYDHTVTDVNGGIRLAFKDKETAEYCGEQFIDLWNDFLL